MKRLLSILILLSMLVVPAWGWSSYTEGTKKLCLPNSPVCVIVPEKAPDAFAFPKAFMLVNKSFANGNGIAMVQAINADDTVGAFVVGLAVAAFVLAGRRAIGPPPGWLRPLGIHAGRWRAIRRALRHIRSGMDGVRHARPGAMLVAFMLSLAHIALRLAVLPALIYGSGIGAPLTPLVVWPLLLLYGGAVAPAPGGGGAVEFGFSLGLKNVLPPSVLAGALIWWRFYSFYLYLLAGAIVAGTTVVRAINSSSKLPSPAL